MYRFQNKRRPSSSGNNLTVSKHYVSFAGTTIETTITDKAAAATQWVEEITAAYGGTSAVVGLDVEWRPNRSPHSNNKSATLQLCIDNKCLILQLFYMDEIPESLKDFLTNPNFTFVGVEVDDDILKLRNEYGIECSSSADVRAVAKEKWPGRFSRPGLKDLAAELCGLSMKKPKHVCMSNWEARVLNDSQIEYACVDAFASFKIGHLLLIQK